MSTHTQIFPVIEICGHLWGLHITATTAIWKKDNILLKNITEQDISGKVVISGPEYNMYAETSQ